MRYQMKQEIFTFGDKYAIQNERGDDVYYVDGRVFSLGHKLAFEDLGGNELAFIQQKLLSFASQYEIYRGNQHAATVKKELFTFFQCTFHIHVDGQPDLEATGNLSDHEYEFRRNGEWVAQVSKEWFTLADTYGVDIADGEDAVLLLACTVVIDLCCHGDRR